MQQHKHTNHKDIIIIIITNEEIKVTLSRKRCRGIKTLSSQQSQPMFNAKCIKMIH